MTVDFGHGTPASERVKRSATASSPGRSRAATGGRWRFEKVRSVSDDQDVYGASVLSGFGRVGIVSTAELIRAWLVRRRSRGRECRKSQSGAPFVRTANCNWFLRPSRSRLRASFFLGRATVPSLPHRPCSSQPSSPKGGHCVH